MFYKLAKFEQQFRTTNNLELYDKKPFTMLTISYILLAQFWKKFLQVKQLMHASKAILNLPTSSLHLCSPFQQNRKVKIHHQFTSFSKQLGQDSPPGK